VSADISGNEADPSLRVICNTFALVTNTGSVRNASMLYSLRPIKYKMLRGHLIAWNRGSILELYSLRLYLYMHRIRNVMYHI
jgi:hypothetical protein